MTTIKKELKILFLGVFVLYVFAYPKKKKCNCLFLYFAKLKARIL